MQIAFVDYGNEEHAKSLLRLLNLYAMEAAAGGRPLNVHVRENLIDELAKRADAFSILAYSDGMAIGLANCFEGFSTFACRPLLNIHDLMVVAEYRRQGVCRRMLEALEQIARDRGYCKLTLEVLRNNHPARAAYDQFGFELFGLEPEFGEGLMMQKNLLAADDQDSSKTSSVSRK